MLLGGAVADLIGRRAFMAGLALIATTVPTEPERTRALGIWGGVATAGMAAGILLGGLLTAASGWRAVLLVDVPLGLAAFALAPVLLAADRPALPARLDVRGALLVTAGFVALTLDLLLMAVACALLARLPVAAAFPVDLLPAMLGLAVGLGIAFASATAGALDGVGDDEQGVASGVLNTAIQIGAAAGIALLATASAGAAPAHPGDAVTEGVHVAGAADAGQPRVDRHDGHRRRLV